MNVEDEARQAAIAALTELGMKLTMGYELAKSQGNEALAKFGKTLDEGEKRMKEILRSVGSELTESDREALRAWRAGVKGAEADHQESARLAQLPEAFRLGATLDTPESCAKRRIELRWLVMWGDHVKAGINVEPLWKELQEAESKLGRA